MSKLRLVAVDDHPDSGALVARIAERNGYEAVSTADPTELGALLERWRPDVLTMDICMPQADAIELFAVLKEAEFAGRVLIISGQDDALRRSAAKLARVKGIRVIDTLEKPIDVRLLRGLLVAMQSDAA